MAPDPASPCSLPCLYRVFHPVFELPCLRQTGLFLEFLTVSSLETLEQKHFFLLLLILDCSRHQGKISSIGLRSSRKEDTGGQVRLRPPYEFYRLACEAAKRGGLGVDEYLSNVRRLQDEFIKSKEVVDRGNFILALRDAMLGTEFTLILGGKSLGKTLIRNKTVCDMENEADAKLTIVDVNMREYPSQELFNAILGRFAEKSSDWASNLKQIAEKMASGFGRLTSAAFVRANADKVAPAASTPISTAIADLIESLSSVDKEKTLSSLIGGLKGKSGNATCIVVDEANLALPVPTDSESARRALQYFVMLTKETSIASVVLITSELGYPYRLQACGMNLRDIANIIIANEVPKKEMVELMVNRWNMSIDLAEEFFNYYGGDVHLCCRGVKQLHARGDDFNPFASLECPGLPSCAADPDAKKHLQNLAKQGWSPIYDVEEDRAAKLIAEKNVGGVVPEDAKAFDLPEGIWKGNHENALVPSGTLMRWKIAKELERVDSGARSLDALVGCFRCQVELSHMDTAFELGQVECERTFFFDTTNMRIHQAHDAK